MVTYFTDASYSPQFHISVIGFKQLNKSKIHYEVLSGVKNTQAEAMAIQRCIYHSGCQSDLSKLTIYTDCLREVHRNTSALNLIHLQGHKPTRMKTDLDREFAMVDKAVRRKLRQIVKDLAK